MSTSPVVMVVDGVQAISSLIETVKRYKGRDQTMRKLESQLEELKVILEALKAVLDTRTSMAELLEGPVSRCCNVCSDLEKAIEEFSGKAKMGLRDWGKMEFRKGNIGEFLETLESYKSTISVGLGTINLHTTKATQDVLEKYNEVIKDTEYNLELRLHRIDERLALLTEENSETPSTSIDLEDERVVTEQCLRICEDAKYYIDALMNREPALKHTASSDPMAEEIQKQFQAQLLTNRALQEHKNAFVETIGLIRQRLQTITLEGVSGDDRERLRLQEDINMTKQCLEVCKVASDEVSQKRIYSVGKVIAEGESDQMVVTTLADLFRVDEAMSKDRSAQFVGSTSDDSIQQISKDRYSSRFGAVINPPTRGANIWLPHQSARDGQAQVADERCNRPFPNEMRKRT